MKILFYLFFCPILVKPSFASSEASTLSFAATVKSEIEKTFLEGQLRYEYDNKKNLVKAWRDKNISSNDMEAYLNAYNIANDLERKIKLSKTLREQKHIYTEFSEHVGPVLPAKEKIP